MSLTEVAPGVWTTTSRTWSTLSTVVVADDGRCLVVDPALAVTEVRELAAEITSRGWRVVAGFSTHPHWDHVLWVPELGDVPRWATAAAVRCSVAHRADILREARADAPGHDPRLIGRLTPLLADAATVPWDGPRAVVLPHRAHCIGSAALVLPEQGVILTGDLVSDREVPLLDLGAAEAEDGAGREECLLHALVAEEGAVAGLEIDDPEVGAPALEHGVHARDPGIVELEVRLRRPADHGRHVGELEHRPRPRAGQDHELGHRSSSRAPILLQASEEARSARRRAISGRARGHRGPRGSGRRGAGRAMTPSRHFAR